MSEFKTSHKHSNKVFCTKFNNQDPNIIYSGGWDRQVIIWDIRSGGKGIGAIYGPFICGNAIDTD